MLPVVQEFERVEAASGTSNGWMQDEAAEAVGTSAATPAFDKKYQKFQTAVLSEVVGFYQIETQLCVVQGWDYEKECATV